MEKIEILEKARIDEVKSVKFIFSDRAGTIKNITVPSAQLPNSLEEASWRTSRIDGFIRTYGSDMYLYLY